IFQFRHGTAWRALFLLCVLSYFINVASSEGRVVCYYTNWSVYRPGTAKFNPQNINPYLCTHLIYAFGGFTKDNQMKPFDKYQDIEQGGYAKFTGLKTYNKQLKTMIAIGGWNEASSRFSPLVANPERRQQFIKNILKFLRQNHFDGIDLDWEYPAHREGGKSRDRDNYAEFVRELRAEFERESEKTGRTRLLLTMAVPAGIEYIDKGYDVPKLNKYLDWFNVLTYDFHSSHEPSVNHHAPLYSLEDDSEYNYDAELNIDYSIKYYLKAGADRDKLVLGIPTYGRSYTLINEESTELGAPSEGPGEQGDATREKGYLAYYEICQTLKDDPDWTVVQPNENVMGPYAYRRNQWVGYDDEAIVRKKAEYVVAHGLGGIMFWAIDNDDFRGACSGKPYPLIEAAKEAMLEAFGLGINEVGKPSSPQKPSRSRGRDRNQLTSKPDSGASRQSATRRPAVSSTTTVTPRSTAAIRLTEAEGSSLYIGGRGSTTPAPPTTPDPGSDFKCEEEGFFQHPRDCKKYYWCLDSGPSGLGIVGHQFTCPSGLYFNPAADSCDFARNVPCKTKKSTTSPPITTTTAKTTTTTTRRPASNQNRVTAAPVARPIYPRVSSTTSTTTTTTSTTTTAAPEVIEYDEEDGNEGHSVNRFNDAEEDPQVIKELIDLIRKVGGVEKLEKHLLQNKDGSITLKEHSASVSGNGAPTTPSTISKSLYDRVLKRPGTFSAFTRNRVQVSETTESSKTINNAGVESSGEGNSQSQSSYSKYSSVVRGNSRQGPQNEGIDKIAESEGFLKERKQYVTINRNRGVNREEHDTELTANNETDDEELDVPQPETTTRRPLSAATPSYTSLRRARPSTTTKPAPLESESEEEQEEERHTVVKEQQTQTKHYATLSRTRGRTTERSDIGESEGSGVSVSSTTNRYKYVERTRPTTSSSGSRNAVSDAIDDEADEDDEEEYEDDSQQKNVKFQRNQFTISTTPATTNTRKYASIGRRTTTTTTTPETTTTTATGTETAKASTDTDTKNTNNNNRRNNNNVKTNNVPSAAQIITQEPETTATTTTITNETTEPIDKPNTRITLTTSATNIETTTATTTTTSPPTPTPTTTPTPTPTPTILPTIQTPTTSINSLDLADGINDLFEPQLTTLSPANVDDSFPNTNNNRLNNLAQVASTTTTESEQQATRTTTTTTTDKSDSNNENENENDDKNNIDSEVTTTTTIKTPYKRIRTNINNQNNNRNINKINNDNINNNNAEAVNEASPNVGNSKGLSSVNPSVNSIRTNYSGRRQPQRTSQLELTTTTTTELPSISSPRPFGYPRRRTRPVATKTQTQTAQSTSTTTTTNNNTTTNSTVNVNENDNNENKTLTDVAKTRTRLSQVDRPKVSDINTPKTTNTHQTTSTHNEVVVNLVGNGDNKLRHDVVSSTFNLSTDDDDNDDDRDVHDEQDNREHIKYTWRDARRPTKPTRPSSIKSSIDLHNALVDSNDKDTRRFAGKRLATDNESESRGRHFNSIRGEGDVAAATDETPTVHKRIYQNIARTSSQTEDESATSSSSNEHSRRIYQNIDHSTRQNSGQNDEQIHYNAITHTSSGVQLTDSGSSSFVRHVNTSQNGEAKNQLVAESLTSEDSSTEIPLASFTTERELAEFTTEKDLVTTTTERNLVTTTNERNLVTTTTEKDLVTTTTEKDLPTTTTEKDIVTTTTEKHFVTTTTEKDAEKSSTESVQEINDELAAELPDDDNDSDAVVSTTTEAAVRTTTRQTTTRRTTTAAPLTTTEIPKKQNRKTNIIRRPVALSGQITEGKVALEAETQSVSTETNDEAKETTTALPKRRVLVRGTYRPRKEGDLSSLLAVDANKRGPAYKHQEPQARPQLAPFRETPEAVAREINTGAATVTATANSVETSKQESESEVEVDKTSQVDASSNRKDGRVLHGPVRNRTTSQTESLGGGITRTRTTYLRNIDGGKVVKRVHTKTVHEKPAEYEYIYDEITEQPVSTTPRIITRNRGAVKFQSNDLSSLLALDFASRAQRTKTSQPTVKKTRRRLLKKPKETVEQEEVEEFEYENVEAEIEDEAPSRPTTTRQPTNRPTPSRPKPILRRTRPTTTTTTTETPTTVETEASTRRSAFRFQQPTARTTPTTSTTTTTTTSEPATTAVNGNPTTRRVFKFRRPLRTTTESSPVETDPTEATESESQPTTARNFLKFRSSSSTTTTTTTTTEPPTTSTTPAATTTPSELGDDLTEVQRKLAIALSNFESDNDIASKEVKPKEDSNSNDQLSLPIYHRRKYYQYTKDSPITYIAQTQLPPEPDTSEVSIRQKIHDVFNVSDNATPNNALENQDDEEHYLAMEQAKEINSELSHFLLKTPGSEVAKNEDEHEIQKEEETRVITDISQRQGKTLTTKLEVVKDANETQRARGFRTYSQLNPTAATTDDTAESDSPNSTPKTIFNTARRFQSRTTTTTTENPNEVEKNDGLEADIEDENESVATEAVTPRLRIDLTRSFSLPVERPTTRRLISSRRPLLGGFTTASSLKADDDEQDGDIASPRSRISTTTATTTTERPTRRRVLFGSRNRSSATNTEINQLENEETASQRESIKVDGDENLNDSNTRTSTTTARTTTNDRFTRRRQFFENRNLRNSTTSQSESSKVDENETNDKEQDEEDIISPRSRISTTTARTTTNGRPTRRRQLFGNRNRSSATNVKDENEEGTSQIEDEDQDSLIDTTSTRTRFSTSTARTTTNGSPTRRRQLFANRNRFSVTNAKINTENNEDEETTSQSKSVSVNESTTETTTRKIYSSRRLPIRGRLNGSTTTTPAQPEDENSSDEVTTSTTSKPSAARTDIFRRGFGTRSRLVTTTASPSTVSSTTANELTTRRPFAPLNRSRSRFRTPSTTAATPIDNENEASIDDDEDEVGTSTGQRQTFQRTQQRTRVLFGQNRDTTSTVSQQSRRLPTAAPRRVSSTTRRNIVAFNRNLYSRNKPIEDVDDEEPENDEEEDEYENVNDVEEEPEESTSNARTQFGTQTAKTLTQLRTETAKTRTRTQTESQFGDNEDDENDDENDENEDEDEYDNDGNDVEGNVNDDGNTVEVSLNNRINNNNSTNTVDIRNLSSQRSTSNSTVANYFNNRFKFSNVNANKNNISNNNNNNKNTTNDGNKQNIYTRNYIKNKLVTITVNANDTTGDANSVEAEASHNDNENEDDDELLDENDNSDKKKSVVISGSPERGSGLNDLGNDVNSKRRFQNRYQLSRTRGSGSTTSRTTTITTTTTAPPTARRFAFGTRSRTQVTKLATRDPQTNDESDEEEDGEEGEADSGEDQEDAATETTTAKITLTATTTTTTTAPPTATKPTLKRVRVIKYRRPLQSIDSNDSDNDSTNSTTNSVATRTHTESQNTNTTTTTTTTTILNSESNNNGTTRKRFRKIVRKLRPVDVAQTTTVEPEIKVKTDQDQHAVSGSETTTTTRKPFHPSRSRFESSQKQEPDEKEVSDDDVDVDVEQNKVLLPQRRPNDLQSLRNRLKAQQAQGEGTDGVISTRLTGGKSNEAAHTGEESELQKLRDKVKAEQARGSGEQGVINDRLKKVLAEKNANAPDRPETTTRAGLTLGTGSSPRPFFRRKLVAKRPIATISTINSTRSTTTTATYKRRKNGRFDPFNSSVQNKGEGFVRTDPRGRLDANRFKQQQQQQEDDGDDDDEDEDDDSYEAQQELPQTQVNVRPALANQEIVRRPFVPIKKLPQPPVRQTEESQEEDDDEDDNEDDEEDEGEDDNEDEQVEKQSQAPHSSQEVDSSTNQPKSNSPYRPNRVLPGSRPNIAPTAGGNAGNVPYNSRNRNASSSSVNSSSSTSSSTPANRFGSSNRPRVVNRPLGVATPNLTLRPVANNYERTTPLTPLKPAPFIPSNTRSYERKYTGPSTETPEISLENSLIEDLNIDALNARNKKIFDIHSKKHTTLKPKVATKEAETEQEAGAEAEVVNKQQQQLLEENQGYVTTTPSTPTETTTTSPNPTQITQQSTDTTVTNTETETTIDSIDNDTAQPPTNVFNANANEATNISSLFTQNHRSPASALSSTTSPPPPATTLLHVFTLLDGETNDGDDHEPTGRPATTSKNRHKITASVEPKHKLIEINRIVEINSKQARLAQRKSKANQEFSPGILRVESLPHVEQLGEISVVKYVHLVDGSDIQVNDGHSTVADYTPTESIIPKSVSSSAPVRNSLPETESSSVGDSDSERNGKSLLPEVIREAFETSTISLEGLFDSARKAKLLNINNNINGNSNSNSNSEDEELRTPTATTTTTATATMTTATAALTSTATATVSRRPVLSVRRRIINTPVAKSEATTQPTDELLTTTSNKYIRRGSKQSTAAAAASAATTTTTPATSTSNIHLGKLKTQSSSATIYSNNNNNNNNGSSVANINVDSTQQQQKQHKFQAASFALRRQFQTRRLTTTASPANNDESSTEVPRTQNPLFKRRLTLTSTAQPPRTTTIAPEITTDFGIDNDGDQVAKSSIQSSQFNQIPEQVRPASISTTAPHFTVNNSTRRQLIARPRRPQSVTSTTTAAPEFAPPLSRRQQSRRRPHKYIEVYNRPPGKPALTTPLPAPTNPAAIRRSSAYNDYTDDSQPQLRKKSKKQQPQSPPKVVLHGRGIIECLDEGNFPHPNSCRKFISCAKFVETGGIVGWEYTCPKGLGYDSLSGMCTYVTTSDGKACRD
ncbi:hypothetical protein KR215_002570, partial [Drosophila sulfurigaster]